jgi:hypothetical protein
VFYLDDSAHGLLTPRADLCRGRNLEIPELKRTHFILTEKKEYKINKEVISTFNKDIVRQCKTGDSCIFKGQCHVFVFSFCPLPECKYPTYGNPAEKQLKVRELLRTNLKTKIKKKVGSSIF